MSTEQREKFLSEQHVGVIAIARQEGPPLAVPVWYDYTPGGEVVVQTAPESLKGKLLDAAGEFSLAVQVETPPYRYVSVSGPVVAVAPSTQEELERMASRYLDDPSEFLASIEGSPNVTLRMRPNRWYSTDYSL
ncbi:pyridoxamine 5'-phosphate oxidase family protein [Lentzea sp. NPDC051213]|uniref:pyridoxamine 5'-phosphate oxidase family protein n=1 Tax=Lentzea sp. NPDC051213 TaxID=3364126 RepID=UPI0037AAD1E9